MVSLTSGIARALFNHMTKTKNFVIIETITLSNFCPLMNLFMHLGFDIEDIRTYGINLVIYKDSKNTVIRSTTGSIKNAFGDFRTCSKLHNKEMCDICHYKKKCFRQRVTCKNKLFGMFQEP